LNLRFTLLLPSWLDYRVPTTPCTSPLKTKRLKTLSTYQENVAWIKSSWYYSRNIGGDIRDHVPPRSKYWGDVSPLSHRDRRLCFCCCIARWTGEEAVINLPPRIKSFAALHNPRYLVKLELVLNSQLCCAPESYKAVGVARNWSWEGRTEARRAENRSLWGGTACPSPPARGSGAEPRPQTHFGHEKALKMHVVGINVVSFTARICIHKITTIKVWRTAVALTAPPGYATV